jgi:hypothetical protein
MARSGTHVGCRTLLAARVHGSSENGGATMARAGSATGKRTVVKPSGAGSSRFVRRDSQGQFTKDQVKTGRSVARDRRVDAKSKAPKGMKDRGD